MKKVERILFGLIAILGVLVISISNASARDTALSEEAQKCLDCHATKKDTLKKFEDNESVSVYVDVEEFKKSAHNFSCSGCHTDFSADKHPARRFRSKDQYKIRLSLECRRCHTGEQIKLKPIHAGLLREETEGKAVICTDCHSAHSVMRVVGRQKFTSEKQHCLSCHGYDLKMVFKDGEPLFLKIDPLLLQASEHKDLSCSDCHFGFSSEEHPNRKFRNKRDFTIASAENCRRCHFDKYIKTRESIHFSVLNRGNLNAPVCTDCHGAHSIHAGRVEKVASGKRCEKCHEEIFKVYSMSIHGKALISEHIQDVPICVDCHSAHSMRDPRTSDYREMIPEMCGNCHANKEIMGKYGLSTDVVKTYLADFHGVTAGFYKKQRETLYESTKQIAVCTDCHGIHDIISTRNTTPAVLKANIVRKCQRCHKDATENFPDAWLSHYVPSFKKAPMVYAMNLVYDIFIPIMLIGLLLQIFLHIWRYASNR